LDSVAEAGFGEHRRDGGRRGGFGDEEGGGDRCGRVHRRHRPPTPGRWVRHSLPSWCLVGPDRVRVAAALVLAGWG